MAAAAHRSLLIPLRTELPLALLQETCSSLLWLGTPKTGLFPLPIPLEGFRRAECHMPGHRVSWPVGGWWGKLLSSLVRRREFLIEERKRENLGECRLEN